MSTNASPFLDEDLGQQSSLLVNAEVQTSSFDAFVDSFPLQGERLYSALFERHSEIVQTQKAKFALANLEKIFNATFEISSVSGFDRMSLRDLSRKTGMSMGAIYSCIGKKEDIALMIADMVRMSSELTRRHALRVDGLWNRMEQTIRFHLYASTLLQPWYFFLYFETRSLPEQQQQESKQIELNAIESIESVIDQGIASGEFHTDHPKMLANTVVVLLEDWYLKPWKSQMLGRKKLTLSQQAEKLNNYNQAIIELVKKQLAKTS